MDDLPGCIPHIDEPHASPSAASLQQLQHALEQHHEELRQSITRALDGHSAFTQRALRAFAGKSVFADQLVTSPSFHLPESSPPGLAQRSLRQSAINTALPQLPQSPCPLLATSDDDVRRSDTEKEVSFSRSRDGAMMKRSRRLIIIEEDRQGLRESSLGYIVHHKWYNVANAIAIMANAILIAAETEVRSQNSSSYNGLVLPGRQWGFEIMRALMAAIFSIEIAMRISLNGTAFFVTNWNRFDLLVVLAAISESVSTLASGRASMDSGNTFHILASNASMLRIVLLLRAVVNTKVLKEQLRELRIIVFSILGSVRSLFWCMITLGVMLLIFAVFFTQGVVSYCVTRNKMQDESTEQMRYFFGTLFNSISSLFVAVTGGRDWGEVMDVLLPLGFGYRVVFYLFIVFAIFALMNIITAVIIESTLTRSKNDHMFVIEHQIHEKDTFIGDVEQVFDELDDDDSGRITLAEFEEHLGRPKVEAYFRGIGLDVKEVSRLFSLMDTDGSGGVSRSEFMDGCLKLKGEATNLDVAIVRYEVQALRQMILILDKHLSDGTRRKLRRPSWNLKS